MIGEECNGLWRFSCRLIKAVAEGKQRLTRSGSLFAALESNASTSCSELHHDCGPRMRCTHQGEPAPCRAVQLTELQRRLLMSQLAVSRPFLLRRLCRRR